MASGGADIKFPFPPKIILDYFNKRGIPLTKSDIEEPVPERVIQCLDFLVAQICGMDASNLNMPTISTPAEIEEMSLLINKTLVIEYLIEMFWVGKGPSFDFSIKCILNPTKISTLKVFSCLVNIAHFIETKSLPVAKPLLDEMMDMKNKKNYLQEEIKALKSKIEKCKIEEEKRASVAAEIRTENEALLQKNKQAQKILKDAKTLSSSLDDETAQAKDEYLKQKDNLERLERENARLDCWLIRSPEKLAATIEQLENKVAELKKHQKSEKAKLKSAEERYRAILEIREEVERIVALGNQANAEKVHLEEAETEIKEIVKKHELVILESKSLATEKVATNKANEHLKSRMEADAFKHAKKKQDLEAQIDRLEQELSKIRLALGDNQLASQAMANDCVQVLMDIKEIEENHQERMSKAEKTMQAIGTKAAMLSEEQKARLAHIDGQMTLFVDQMKREEMELQTLLPNQQRQTQ